MARLKDLLQRGYFPRELPPPFTTESFAAGVVSASGTLDAALAVGKPDHAELCIHNMVRSGGLRRHLGIPNPVPFSRLCEFIGAEWALLQPAAHRSPYSLTSPVVSPGPRAIVGKQGLGDRTSKRVELRAQARCVLRCDVSRFYTSIYTHSLPWGIEGKDFVKAQWAAQNMSAVWSNDLDKFARNLNDRQTVGIPIGPDASLLLAECLLSAVDQELAAQHPSLKGIRFIDDYEFALRDRGEAERVVSDLQAILSRYELALNPSKTRIIDLPDTLEEPWASQLRVFVFRDAGVKGQRNDLTAYFDRVFTFSAADRHADVIKYAIPRLNSLNVAPENWPVFQRLLCQCVSVEPACLPQVCEQLVHYLSTDVSIDAPLWMTVLNRVVTEQLPLAQASEALWALWLLKVLDLKLQPKAESCVDACEDDSVALMALGLASVGLADPKSFKRLHNFAEPAELVGRHWLLCYEGNKQGWLTPPSGAAPFASSGAFAFLHSRGVSFFDINAVPPSPRRNILLAGGGGGGGSM